MLTEGRGPGRDGTNATLTNGDNFLLYKHSPFLCLSQPTSASYLQLKFSHMVCGENIFSYPHPCHVGYWVLSSAEALGCYTSTNKTVLSSWFRKTAWLILHLMLQTQWNTFQMYKHKKELLKTITKMEPTSLIFSPSYKKDTLVIKTKTTAK